MNALVAFVLGLLSGWIIEWIIDWVYWRRRTGVLQDENNRLRDQLAQAQAATKDQEGHRQPPLAQAEEKNGELEGQLRARLAQAEARNKDLERQLAIQAPIPVGAPEKLASVEAGANVLPQSVPAAPPDQDDLILINGIGPVIAGKLGQAGIRTFDQLAHLTPDQLRGIVGDSISRLADEEDLITQAKHFAAQKRGRG